MRVNQTGTARVSDLWKLFSVAGLALVLQGLNALAQVTNVGPIQTNFFRGPALTAEEIQTVLQLAKECGMAQPEQIADVRNLPDLKGIPRSLSVRSVERIVGRTVSLDTMVVGCTNWSPIQRALGPKQLGKFYVNPPFLQTWEWTLFQVGNKTLRVRVGKGIPSEIADELIPKIVKGEVQLGRDVSRAEWSQAELSEPSVLSRHPTTGEYLVYFGTPLDMMITVQLHNGRVLVTDFSRWVY